MLVLANGRSGMPPIRRNSALCKQFREALRHVMLELAQAVVRDGERVTKFVTVEVKGARTYLDRQARRRGRLQVRAGESPRGTAATRTGAACSTPSATRAARIREDEQLLLRLLRSEGYYDGTGTITSEQVPEQAGQLRVTVTAVPGDRYRLGEIAISGPETVPPGLAREALPRAAPSAPPRGFAQRSAWDVGGGGTLPLAAAVPGDRWR